MDNKPVEPSENDQSDRDNQNTMGLEPPTENNMNTSEPLPPIESEPVSDNQVPIAHPFIQEPKGSKKPLIIGLIIVLLLLVAGAAAYYFLVVNKPTEDTTPVVQNTPTITPELTAKTLVDQAKDKLTATEVTGIENGKVADGSTVYQAASYQTSGKKFLTNAAELFGTASSSPAADKTAIDADYSALVSFLKDKDFTTTNPTVDPDSKTPRYVLFKTDKIVCTVSVVYAQKANNYAGIGCSDMASFEEVATKVQPFYDAYVLAKPAVATDTETPPWFDTPVIKDGVESYKNASVPMILMTGFFYQEPSKDVWKFVAETNPTPTCVTFNTDILKKAFSGIACTDAAGKASTVKV